MEELLDFNIDLDIFLLDKVVDAFYEGSGDIQTEAGNVLSRLQEHPDSWQRTDKILQFSTNPKTKFLAVSILDKLISTRWKMLPIEQRLGIRNFVVGMIISFCMDDETFQMQRSLITKCNFTLVSIVLQEWPQEWPGFISELISSSASSTNVCENNLTILRLLAEEIFEFSSEAMTQKKADLMNRSILNEIVTIFNFSLSTLVSPPSSTTISIAIDCLIKYIPFTPNNLIIESNVIDIMIDRYLVPKTYRSLTLRCITEAVQSLAKGDDLLLKQKLASQFENILRQVTADIFERSSDLAHIFLGGSNEDQEYFRDFTIFITSFLSDYRPYLESEIQFNNLLINAHLILVQLTKIKEKTLFKISLDYWRSMLLVQYQEVQSIPVIQLSLSASGGAVNPSFLKRFPLKLNEYSRLYSDLRLTIVDRMVRPEEVLILKNDEGEISKQYVQDTENEQLFKIERDVLIYLSRFDIVETETILLQKLDSLSSNLKVDQNKLNQLCWAVGSIAGVMSEESEKSFLPKVMKYLLSLSDDNMNPNEGIIITSNIIYVAGQYPKFLKTHWSFLKTVILKLFEVIHEPNEAIKDMSCETFSRIALKCKSSFLITHPFQSTPLINEIIGDIGQITSDLNTSQVQSFYESCGIIIGDERKVSQRNSLLSDLMELPNIAWKSLMTTDRNADSLFLDPENLVVINNIIKTNSAVCSGMEEGFYSQFEKILEDVVHLYGFSTKFIERIENTSNNATEFEDNINILKLLRGIKRNILKLVKLLMRNVHNQEEVLNFINSEFLDVVLTDFVKSENEVKEVEVLSCMISLVSSTNVTISDYVDKIYDAIFFTTLNMIKGDLVEYPEHRIEFYKLLEQINKKYFNTLIKLSDQKFKLFIDTICWGIKHTNRDIEIRSLQIGLDLIHNIEKLGHNRVFSINFYRAHYLTLLSEVFYAMTDPDHKAGFNRQSLLLMKLVSLIENGALSVSVFRNDDMEPRISNHTFLIEYMSNLINNAFTQLSREQIIVFLSALTKLYDNKKRFNGILRDFLVQSKEFGGDPTDYLFVEEEDIFSAEEKLNERDYNQRLKSY
ncbi:hypothetical protein Kpol_1010p55 [Vanderwaltozyma polyspora DSM 70294]|uniref:Exportin-1 n=1 Tax=Vanderwaltozyma polyspora (strain ATCC 22028 / DSM 70294 / BCRC 21397 / CBS 2163 / NBRC 10782 / NRRL Y-8283 / UCD 57-17) TaxID=436907 RepID=A7TIK1_VANPO|nr:uncharacterized protein Kpol_1010p55 [Vanderwaltozyma polyspora DSM 70294]EDO17939.1 hypothetical protein Kpol_1010p55 [Vanderwaltozyma polyspora DSM 70294]